MKPLVDINIAVYNHAPFLRQTLDGVLAQKTNFPYRLLIGDDCSTDGSIEILKEYEDKYHDKIKVIYHPINIGLNSTDRNGIILLKNSTAKYIALLDGDDYWIDPFKLQKQVDFLESNNDFAICFHNSKIIFEDEKGKISFTNSDEQPEITRFEDLAKGEFIYTVTCLFRLRDFLKLPEKYYSFINNYTLDLHNAQYGSIKYINEVMSVYRKHKGGMWSMVDREKTLINQLPTYTFYLHYFNKKHKPIFRKHLKDMTAELLSIKMERKDVKGFWTYYYKYVKYNADSFRDLKHIISIFLKGCKMKFVNLFKNNG